MSTTTKARGHMYFDYANTPEATYYVACMEGIYNDPIWLVETAGPEVDQATILNYWIDLYGQPQRLYYLDEKKFEASPPHLKKNGIETLQYPGCHPKQLDRKIKTIQSIITGSINKDEECFDPYLLILEKLQTGWLDGPGEFSGGGMRSTDDIETFRKNLSEIQIKFEKSSNKNELFVALQKLLYSILATNYNKKFSKAESYILNKLKTAYIFANNVWKMVPGVPVYFYAMGKLREGLCTGSKKDGWLYTVMALEKGKQAHYEIPAYSVVVI